MANCARLILRRAAAANLNTISVAKWTRTASSLGLGPLQQTQQTLFRFQPQVQRLQRRSYSDQKGEEGNDGQVAEVDAKDPVVVVDKDEQLHVMSIAINRPDKRNCVNEETAAALWQAFHDFEEDDNMRFVWTI